MKDYLLIKAKKLRKNGYSFREISEILNISKSTASVWSREEEISKIGIKRLEDIREKAIKKSKQVNHQKKVKFLEKLERETIEISGDYSIKDYKIFLALLYWGEGAKTGHSVRFINSDPLVIKSFLWLFRRSFNCDESKFRPMLHLHGYHNQEQMISFWADITNVPPKQFHVYIKKNNGVAKKEGYKGCLSIQYHDAKILYEIFLIIKRFALFAN